MSLANRAQDFDAPVPAWFGTSWQSSRHADPSAGEGTPPATTLPAGELTELYCQSAGLNQLRLLVPVLAELSQQNKWVTFIAPPCLPNAAALAHAGVDTRKVQVVHAKTIRDYWLTLERALANGMSSVVLAWPSTAGLDAQRRQRLQDSASKGGTATVLLHRLSEFRAAKPDLCPVMEGGQLCLDF